MTAGAQPSFFFLLLGINMEPLWTPSPRLPTNTLFDQQGSHKSLGTRHSLYYLSRPPPCYSALSTCCLVEFHSVQSGPVPPSQNLWQLPPPPPHTHNAAVGCCGGKCFKTQSAVWHIHTHTHTDTAHLSCECVSVHVSVCVCTCLRRSNGIYLSDSVVCCACVSSFLNSSLYWLRMSALGWKVHRPICTFSYHSWLCVFGDW